METPALQQLRKDIGEVVDRWVSTVLRDRFIEKPRNQQTRSLWDRFKQGFSNWWWGPDGDKYNPYKWRNRFGDELGVEESFDVSLFHLREYGEIRGVVDYMESEIEGSDDGFERLRLTRTIRSAAEQLKAMLFDALKDRIVAASDAAPAAPRRRATAVIDDSEDRAAAEAKKKAADEAARVRAGEEAAARAAAKKRAEEEEARNRAEEERARREAEAKKRADQEAARKRAEKEAAKKKAEEEAAKKSGADKPGVEDGPSEDPAKIGDEDAPGESSRSPELEAYIVKGGKRNLGYARKNISKFVVEYMAAGLRGEGEEERAYRVVLWWAKEDARLEEIKKNSNLKDAVDHLYANLIEGDHYIRELSRLSGYGLGRIKNAMIDMYDRQIRAD